MKWLCSELRMIVCSTTLVLLESLRASTLQTVYRDHWPLYSLINHILLWKSEQIWTWTSCRPTALQPGLQSLLQTRAWSAISFIKSIDTALKIQRRLFLGIFQITVLSATGQAFLHLTPLRCSLVRNNLLVLNLTVLWTLPLPTCWTSSWPTCWVSSPSSSCLQQTLWQNMAFWKRCLNTDLLFSKQWDDDDCGKLQDSVRQRSRWWGHWGQRQQSCQVT